MKFASSPVKFVNCQGILNLADAYRRIDKMYLEEYGNKAGIPLEKKTSLTPNEERLAQLILLRFHDLHVSVPSPIVVTCGEHDYVFACYLPYEGWIVPSRDELMG